MWGGLVVGLALAVAAWLLYWRETRARAGAVRWLLPTLRALAVLLLVLMLTGPVLHHRNVIGEVARILLFVDASASMRITDQEMELPRKLFIAHGVKCRFKGASLHRCEKGVEFVASTQASVRHGPRC